MTGKKIREDSPSLPPTLLKKGNGVRFGGMYGRVERSATKQTLLFFLTSLFV